MKINDITPGGFWDNFIEQDWQKNSSLIDGFIDPDIVTEDEAFLMLLTSLETYVTRKGSRATLKIFRNGKSMTPDECNELGVLPKASDVNFDGYYHRLKPEIQNQEFCVVLDRAELNPATRDVVYGLLKNVYSRLGFIAPDSFAFFFFGEYTKTPFGVHIHDCEIECDSTFIISLRGEKNIWLWEKGYEAQYPEMNGSLNVDKYMPDSYKLRATPGQAIYFPSYLMHIGESAVQKSFNLFVATKPARDVTQSFFNYLDFQIDDYLDVKAISQTRNILAALNKRYDKSVAHLKQTERSNNKLLFDIHNLQSCALELPVEISDTAKMIGNYVPKPFIELMCVKYWLSVLTSFGLVSHAVQYDVLPLEREQGIELLGNHSLLWAPANDVLVIGCGSYTFEVTPADDGQKTAIQVMIEQINNGSKHIVNDLIQNDSALLDILNKIHTLGVFHIHNVE